MFKNVLVGIDGTPNGRDAIALASDLMDRDGQLTLAHVHVGKLRPSHAITPGRVREEQEDSEKLLEVEHAAADVKARLISIVSMSPGRGLHEQAEEQNADLIVVGSCRHGAFGRVMLGDDTRAALNGAPCAVAIAARGYAEHHVAIARVGVAYNSSPESDAALAIARALVAATRAQVQALEVVTIPTVAYTGIMPLAVGQTVEGMLSEAEGRIKKLPGVEGRAVYGLVGEELAVFGDQLDLLVVGSRGYGPVKRLVLGSTSQYLEGHARCSLLVLPRVAATPAEDSTTSHDYSGQ